MKELIDKISSYNLFNYLLPGVLFVILLRETTNYNLIQEDLFIGAFVYYFVGMIINRVGSLVIESVAKKYKFVVYKPYSEFIKASEKDSKLEVLSETNNMFRSIAGLMLVLIIVISTELIGLKVDFTLGYVKVISVILLFGLLLFAYRKQTKIIYDRVDAKLKDISE